MANDLYQIPTTYNESEIRAEIHDIQKFVNQEYDKAPYQYLKAIEADVFSMREAALQRQANATHHWLRKLVFPPQTLTLHDLIEQESIAAGELFGTGHKFWLDEKVSSMVHSDAADWYYQWVDPHNPKHTEVLRFQVTPTSIHKIYQGREYPIALAELQNLTDAITSYKAATARIYAQ